MWSYLTTRSFISPLPGYVENKAGDAETLSTEGQTTLAAAACQKENERILTMPFLLSHSSPGDKIENCPAQCLPVSWIVRVDLRFIASATVLA